MSEVYIQKHKISIFTIRVVIFLIYLCIVNSCKETKKTNETSVIRDKETNSKELIDDKKDSIYYYLVRDDYANLNKEGKVLLHTSKDDSLWLNPEVVCSLHLTPNWERKEFPHEIFNFPNLEYLWVAMRDFKTLPNEIIQLKELKSLDLQHSGIKRLPENFGKFEKLEELGLLFSDIEVLPNSICELTTLKRLQLGQTKMKELPTCLSELKNLERFIFSCDYGFEFNESLKLVLEKLKNELKDSKFGISYETIEDY